MNIVATSNKIGDVLLELSTIRNKDRKYEQIDAIY